MFFILDRRGEVVGVLNRDGDISKITPYFDDVFIEDLETASTSLEFSTLGNTQESYHLQVGNFIAFKDEEGYQLFQITDVEDEHGDQLLKNVYCEGACLDLLNEVIRPISMPSANIRQFLTTVLNGTSWSVGMIDIQLQDSHTIELDDYTSVYSALQNVGIGQFNAELRFRVEIKNNRIVNRYVDAFKQRGRVTKHRFEYGVNMTKVKKRVDTSELCTALIGVGNNNITFKDVQAEDKPRNQDFIISQEAFDRWNVGGKHIFGLYKTDTESPDELLLLTRKELKRRSMPKVTYEMDVEILGDDVKLGDEVFVIDTDFSPMLLLSARVSTLEKSKSGKSVKCKLSNYKEVRSNITDDMREIASQLEGKLEQIVGSKFPVGTDDIQDSAITSDKIGQDQVYGSHIFANAITTEHLQANSINSEKIQANSINSEKIEANSITTEHLIANVISGDKALIEEGFITTAHIGLGQIQSANIGNAVVESAHIKSGTIDNIHIVNGAIDSAKIQDASINSAHIGSAQITNAHIKELSADKITSGTIDSNVINVTNLNASNITSGSIDASKIKVTNLSADSITSGTIDSNLINVININADNITSGSINASMIDVINLNASNITSGRIDASVIDVVNLNASNITSGTISADRITGLVLEVEDGSITTAKIKDASITSAKIQNGAVGTIHIVDGSINSAKLGVACIGEAHIQDACITSAMIKELNANKITSGTIDTSKIVVSGLNGNLRINNNRMQVFDSQSVPVERVTIGDVNNDGSIYGLRVRGADGRTVLYDENGVYSEGITDGAITNPKISDESITGNKLVIDDIFSNTGFIGALKTVSLDASQITTGKISGERIDITGLVSFDALDPEFKKQFVYDPESGKTFINGDNLYTGSVKAKHIDIKGLSVTNDNNNITFSIDSNGNTDVKGTISSFEYSDEVGKERGYKLTPEGNAFLNNATIRGSVILPKGGITDTDIVGESNSDKQVRFWAGASYENRKEAPFRVLQDGTVIASLGDFNGTVTGAIDIGNIKIEDTNNSKGSITISTNDNTKEVIKLNEDLTFFDTNVIIGNANKKMMDIDKNNSQIVLNESVFKLINSLSNIILGQGGSVIQSNDSQGAHSQRYVDGSYVFDSTGTQANSDYMFSKNGGQSDVDVDIQGNLSVKNKVTINDKIEMVSRTVEGNNGFDFIIK